VLRGRAGRHCGQKRTYRAVADQYAFIPREAVSRFLLHCTQCQKKPVAGLVNNFDIKSEPLTELDGKPSTPQLATPPATPPSEAASCYTGLPYILPPQGPIGPHAALAYAQALNAIQSFAARALYPVVPDSDCLATSLQLQQFQPTAEIDMRLPITSTYLRRMRAITSAGDFSPPSKFFKLEGEDMEAAEDNLGDSSAQPNSPWALARGGGGGQGGVSHQQLTQHNTSTMSPGRSDHSRDDSLIADDASSTGNKDDDDDDDEDDANDENDGFSRDPERLKAFNMFVRLFVDENLDRHVPISKQPKEKIQAIIDSCTRQFPEYSERARKRIRTYLKSCRRTKRSREQAGLDTSNRPTPPHLTSVLAEQLLARACENEADNAKRMRMGMEPVSQPMPVLPAESPPPQSRSDQLVTLLAASQHAASSPPAGVQFSSRQQPPHPTIVGTGQAQTPGHPQPVFGASPMGLLPAGGVRGGGGGQGDQVGAAGQLAHLTGEKKPPLLSHKLSGAEMTAVRQLITGYRESAAFLLRSADELEHLLQIQPKL